MRNGMINTLDLAPLNTPLIQSKRKIERIDMASGTKSYDVSIESHHESIRRIVILSFYHMRHFI
jgi:hypothetical protein